MKHFQRFNQLEQHLAELQNQTRRTFLKGAAGFGGAAFLSQFGGLFGANQAHAATAHLDFGRDPKSPLSPLPPQFAAKAKRVIYLHMAGAPSQLELFDYKPELAKFDGKDCPAEFLEGKSFAFLTGVPKLMGPQFSFKQHGQSGAWLSDRLPHLTKHVDDICFIKSMYTDQFNHAPAQLLMQTGSVQLGHASLGSWTTYGLGTENQNLPGYIVLASGGALPSGGKALWGSGYLPSVYQGVQCRSQGQPVLYLDNPDGVSRNARRNMLDAINALNSDTYQQYGDPETITRTAQYEMAFRMQLEATDAFDIHQETEATRQNYAITDTNSASFAKNCLVARRLAERGVRFIELFDWGWDSHGVIKDEALNMGFKDKCKQIDQPISALLTDLKQSGLLEDTLVVFAGEFGRTPMKENRGGSDNAALLGRDHCPSAYTVWVAGGGIKGGYTHGETDDMGYEVVKDPVSVHDFHATLLYLLGFDSHALNYPYQGLEQRLTGVNPYRVVSQILA
ncbi:DUF1501 domain-containing protein [Catenovulum sp. 2E275]|uniref:DUF1501 domain-containing protein n=1 Tax=Catenovulum sp. 2E275 TaxID=2980497 RepID=UPI0021D18A0A|nr:DUF1501 domain-containing protein [Catenovulum sp. 2E275]MCU4676562.1 DUF1501 domain-containing protein [Catenovulum sp. 2E275]